MKHYCFYIAGVIQEETNSKNIARKLLRGEIAADEEVLDMQSGLWVPVAKQSDIMRIYHSMRKVQRKKGFLDFFVQDSLNRDDDDFPDPVTPERFALGCFPIWSARQIFIGDYILFFCIANIYKSIKNWLGQDDD
ncbi:MAG: hypothetical protein RBS43_06065 [Candidatus Cloacimonas sp.]|jgi:hypothetical protein|nr:hypothetical protein [Candidatus Cloacimonas sp.]